MKLYVILKIKNSLVESVPRIMLYTISNLAYADGGKKLPLATMFLVTHSVFRLHLFLRLSDVPKFYNIYSQTAELNTCMVQGPVGVFWDVVLCSLVVYGESCCVRLLLKVAGFVEVLVPCYVTTLRTSNFLLFCLFLHCFQKCWDVLMGHSFFQRGCYNHCTISFDVLLSGMLLNIRNI